MFVYIVIHIQSLTSYILSLFLLDATLTYYIYTLSLHDALPIFLILVTGYALVKAPPVEKIMIRVASKPKTQASALVTTDRKSTRLNSSHVAISYAVFC